MAVTPHLSRSAKLYQERRIPAAQATRRMPSPRFDAEHNQVHFIPLTTPLPTAEILQDQGGHPPDAGATQPWPHGGDERV